MRALLTVLLLLAAPAQAQLGFSMAGFPGATPQLTTTLTSTLTISGQSNVTYRFYNISTTSGDCVNINNSTNITIKASHIGPCGADLSDTPGHGIYIHGTSSNINIYDNYIHVEHRGSGCGSGGDCDSHDDMLVQNPANHIDIEGNVIGYGATNIELLTPAGQTTNVNNVTINGNFLLNPRAGIPRGQHVQSFGITGHLNTAISVTNNYGVSSTDTVTYLYAANQEDAINFGFTDSPVATGNYIYGGQSASGCGVIADNGVINSNFSFNIIGNQFHCGVGIVAGPTALVDHNKVFDPAPTDANAQGISIANFGGGCSNVTVTNNISYSIQSGGAVSGYWTDGTCGTVTLSGNTFDQGAAGAAFAALNPILTTNPPPLIPPLPFACVISTPYTSQTSKDPC